MQKTTVFGEGWNEKWLCPACTEKEHEKLKEIKDIRERRLDNKQDDK